MRLSIRRKVDLGFAVALAVLAATGVAALVSARQLLRAERWAAADAARDDALQELFADVVEAETARRGWVLTRDASQRARCEEVTGRLDGEAAQLLRLFAGDPEQRGRAAVLAASVAAKVAHQRRALSASPDPAAQAAVTREGTELRERVRVSVVEMRDAERRRVAARLAEARRTGRTTIAVVSATGLLAFVVVAFGLARIHHDMDERERAEEARRRSEEELRRFEAILQATPDIVGIVRPDGAPVWLNRSGREALGLVGAPIEESRALSFFPAWAQERMRAEGIPGAIRDGFWIGETAFTSLEGKEVACSQVILCHRDEAGEVAFLSSILRDISERKEVERIRRELVATVSHELQTPVTAIQGALDVLLEGMAGSLSPEGRRLVEIASRNGTRLARLVRDIIEAEKLEAGGLPFDMRPLAISPIVAQAVEAIRPVADGAGVKIVYEPRVADARSRVDPDRIGQVVTNLLSNAVKFSPRGGVVTVLLERAGDAARISVSDRGPGIPLEFRSRIFGRYAQAESAARRGKEGTGLGLAISKAIVDRHGGRIDFVSEEGKGTTFFVELHDLREALAARQASGAHPRVTS